jgi:hypothetical protein
MNGGTYSWRVDDSNYGINNKLVVSQGNDWGVGIGTDSPTRRFQVVGTTRHERVYAYANNVFQFTNDISQNELWLHLGTQGSFTTDKIYYRVGTNTSEEEGEIIVKNTCSTANIEWFRNSYNVMVTAVKARMQGGCGNCEIWILVRYGSNYGGANTTVQWQVHSGTDSGFATVNTTGTPGTGTNEANIASTDGYMVSTSNNQSVGSRLGVNTTSPASRVHAVEASSGISARTDLGGTIIAEGGTRAGLYILTAGTAAGSYGSIWWGNGNTNTDAYITVGNDTRAMDFGTADGFAMRITSSRNVLIGTTTDSGYKLLVNGTSYIIGAALFGSTLDVNGNVTLTQDTNDLIFQQTNTSTHGIVWKNTSYTKDSASIRPTGNGAWATQGIGFYTGNAGDSTTAPSLRFNIQAAGDSIFYNNVGIGTTGPASPLQVSAASVLSQGVLSVVNTHAGGGVYYPAARFVNQRGNHSYGIVAEFNTGSTSGTDRPSILFNTDINAKSWQVGMVTGDGNWGTNDWFGIGYRANNLPATFNTFPSARLLITDGGNVLIGTTTDAGFKLNVNGDIYANGDIRSQGIFRDYQGEALLQTNTSAITILGSGGAGTPRQLAFYAGNSERMRIDTSGNLLVGTTSGVVKMELIGGVTAFGTVGATARIAQNQVDYRGVVLGFDTSGQIGVIYAETPGPASTLAFWTYSGSAWSEKMRINGSGNVLIGTTTDSGYKLRVNGSSYFDAPILCYTGNGYITALTNDGTGSLDGFGYSFLINNTGHEIGRITGRYTDSASGGSGGMSFFTLSAGTLGKRMELTAGGALNIYNTSPTSTAGTSFIVYAYDTNSYFRLGNNTNNSLDIQLTRSGATMFTVNGHTGLAYFAGNVLIGTTTDAGYKLDVAGTFRASTSGSVARMQTSTNASEVLQLANSGGDSGSVQGVTHLGINFFSVGTNSPVRITAFQESNSGYRGGMYFSTRNANSDSAPSEAMRISPDQLVGIGTSGTTAADYRLTVDSTGVDYAIYSFGSTHVDNGALGVGVVPSATIGRIDASNDIVAYSSSDKRLKENITPIANALDKVKALTGVEFDWKPEHKAAHGYEGHDTGVIAQEVKEIMPSAVRENETGFLAVRYEKLIGLLIEAVKEQQAEIDELKKLIK